MAVLVAHKFDRRNQELELYTFFDGVIALFRLARHFFFSTAVIVDNRAILDAQLYLQDDVQFARSP